MFKVDNAATYFAALNTGQGFVSYFRQIFDPCETVYVIKGGSGTGKSRFMREVSNAAKSKGYSVEEFLCSSDPSSLDGILIKEKSLAVLDGTAPHIHEPTLIGARERFIDLSVFLDCEQLKLKRDEIASLSASKARRYQQIYEYLYVISSLDRSVNKLVLNSFEKDKMEKAVKKSVLYVQKSDIYEKKIRIRSSIGTEGSITLNSYSLKAKKRFAICDLCGLGGIYLKLLLEASDKIGASVEVSYSPFAPDLPDALYYPDTCTAFYIGIEGEPNEDIINMRRFAIDEKLRPYKPEIRSLNKLKNSVIERMLYDFASVKRLHFALEEIYSAAMDFKAKEEFTKAFIRERI